MLKGFGTTFRSAGKFAIKSEQKVKETKVERAKAYGDNSELYYYITIWHMKIEAINYYE